jgi:hypothetical protein
LVCTASGSPLTVECDGDRGVVVYRVGGGVQGMWRVRAGVRVCRSCGGSECKWPNRIGADIHETRHISTVHCTVESAGPAPLTLSRRPAPAGFA